MNSVAPIESRVPPHDSDAEGAVLSAVMIDPDGYAAVGDFLAPEHFYGEAHRRIFEACAALAGADSAIDIVHVGGWLKDRGRLAQAGGMAYLTEVLNAAPTVRNVRSYGMRVHSQWRLRQVLIHAQRVAAQVYAGVEDSQEYCEQTAEAFHSFAFAPGIGGGLEPIGAALNAAVERVETAQKSGRSLLGMATGIVRYDRIVGGLHDSDLTIIAARPGKGKSALALQAAVNVAENHGPVAHFSLEMPRDQLAMRAACNEARVDVQLARIGRLRPSDWNRLTPAQDRLGGLPLLIDDTAAISVVAMRAKLRRLQLDIERDKLQLGGRHSVRIWRAPPGHEKRIRLIVVDYLQLMSATSTAERQSRERAVSECSSALKAIAKEFRCPVIALAQMNRAIEDSDRRPRLRDLRESGAIEQDADNVVFIHGHGKEKSVVELIVEKQRNGPADIACVRFDKQYTRFDNLADGEFEVDNGADASGHADTCSCADCQADRNFTPAGGWR